VIFFPPKQEKRFSPAFLLYRPLIPPPPLFPPVGGNNGPSLLFRKRKDSFFSEKREALQIFGKIPPEGRTFWILVLCFLEKDGWSPSCPFASGGRTVFSFTFLDFFLQMESS